MKFKAVVFDLDGTLIDSLRDIAESMNRALETMGFDPHPVEQYRKYVGYGLEILAQNVVPQESRNDRILGECVRLMREEYGKRWSRFTAPYPGIMELLERLNSLNVKSAVLSNKVHEFTLQVVDGLLEARLFTVIKGSVPSLPKKPHPAQALQILKEMRLQPPEAVFLGDTRTDMETAVAAGMFPVGALWGYRDAEELRTYGARELITKPLDLLDLLL